MQDWNRTIGGAVELGEVSAADVQQRFLRWIADLRPFYTSGSSLRDLALRRLQSRYWQVLIQRHVHGAHPYESGNLVEEDQEDGLDDDLAVFWDLPQYEHIPSHGGRRHGAAWLQASASQSSA